MAANFTCGSPETEAVSLFNLVQKIIFIVGIAVGVSACGDGKRDVAKTSTPVGANADVAEVTEVNWSAVDLNSLKSERLRDGLKWVKKHEAKKAAAFLITEIRGSAFGDPTEEEVKEQELFDTEVDSLIAKQPALGIVIGDLLLVASGDDGYLWRWYSLSAKHGSRIAAAKLAERRAPWEQERATAAEAAAASAPAAPRSPLIGDWTCQSRKADGTVFETAFRFTPDGAFAYVDPQSRMFGTYDSSGPNTRVAVTQTNVGGRVSNSGMDITVGTVLAAPGQLRFEMTLVRLGVVIANTCVTEAVAAATPATKVDVCAINPAACAAIQRNSDIRSQVQDQRCAILKSQLAGTMGGDYQLAKAGCR